MSHLATPSSLPVTYKREQALLPHDWLRRYIINRGHDATRLEQAHSQLEEEEEEAGSQL